MRAPSIALVALCVLGPFCAVQADGAAPVDAWTIIIGGREVTIPTQQPIGEMPVVDPRRIAGELDLGIEHRGDRIVIRDVRGITWTIADGSVLLEGPGITRTLARPAVITEATAALPLDCIAALAQRRLVLNGRQASLVPAEAAPPRLVADTATHVPTGWERVPMEKTAAELDEMRRLENDVPTPDERPAAAQILPPAHDTMRFDVGAGFAQGNTAATDLIVSGRTGGAQVSLAMFLTYGSSGATYRSGRLTVQEPTGRWTLQAGDLFSDVRGLARGIRVGTSLWSRWRPSVAVYGSTPALSTTDGVAAAYRDDLQLPADVSVRSEILSDRSRLVGMRWIRGRAGLDVFYRATPVRATTEHGGMLSYNLFHGVTAQFGVRRATGSLVESWYFGSLQVPIGTWAAVSVERTRKTNTPDGNALALHLPLGRMRVMQRFQWTDITWVRDPAITSAGLRQLQSVASFSPMRRVQLSYQVATQWSAATVARQWTELQTVISLSRATSFQAVTGLPDIGNPQRFRFGIQQNLRGGFRLAVDYGRLPAFQTNEGAVDDTPRFLVMVRRGFTRATPAGGATVTGRVVDERGRPVSGAAVTLGPYRTTASADGSYRFSHVPPGDAELTLDAAHLPAQFASDGVTQHLHIGPVGNLEHELHAIPLRSIHGHVFVDRNENGVFDVGEGVSDVVMRLDDDRSTMTGADGAYGFYNLPPRTYEVRLDTERLRRDLTVLSDSTIEIVIDNDGHSVSGVDVRVTPREKPIVFQKGSPE